MSDEHAPQPDEKMRDLDAASWRLVSRSVIRRFMTDQCLDTAAALTFYAVLALIPAAMVIVSLVSILGPDSEVLRLVVGLVSALASPEASDAVMDVVDELAGSSIAGVALVGGLALTLWSGSRYVAAFSRGMNNIYRADEGRRLWVMRATHLGIALVLLLAAVTAALVIASPTGWWVRSATSSAGATPRWSPG